jgi:HEAT repeat protein
LREEKEPALRVVAVDAMAARVPRELLAIAIDDSDPGVRLAALGGLIKDTDGATDAAVIARLGKDGWPAVRTAAARVLGRRCGHKGVSVALLGAVGGDDSDDVRRTALEALVACKEAGLGPKLVELARDRNLSGGLREYATAQIAVAGGSKMVDELISLLKDARENSIGEEDNMRVAAAAAWALGTLKDPRATAALFDAATDPTFPMIQAAALAAIGEFCPAGSAKVLAAGVASDDQVVVRAARLAQRKCKK